MKKILFTLIIGIFFISLISASISNLGSFKRYQCIELPQTCSDCTYNNISTIIRTGDIPIINYISNSMSRSDTYYNYTFCNTTELGEYTVNGFGNPDGEKQIWNYNFYITETGKEEVSVLNNSLLIILVILGVIFLVIGIKFKIIGLGFLGGLLFLLGGVYTTIYGFNSLANMYTRGLGISLIGFGIIIMFCAVYEGILNDD